MKNNLYISFFILFLLVVARCKETATMNADLLLEKTIENHGSRFLYEKRIDFDFRDWHYSMFRDSSYYEYTRTRDSIADHLHSQDGFSRLVNGQEVAVADSMVAKYSNSLNSVLYFFQTPLVLNDAAVQKEYLDTITIKDKMYHTLRVSFNQEGGGEDFEDEFRYWINSETYEIDYMAYSYLTNGGGVRFREAFRKERLNGILFQDYRNFKPLDKDTSLDSLPAMFESGELQLLSVIENTGIRVKEK